MNSSVNVEIEFYIFLIYQFFTENISFNVVNAAGFFFLLLLLLFVC